ncbi:MULTISPECIES: imm11 family protein [unclassified Pseudomonas]|uniref:imm11 family protein n=1 Tax=unclassified Pseudomonas TaxID=196821 RepID=UPI0030D73B23
MILSWKAPVYHNEKLLGSYDAESGSYETAGSNFDYLSLLSGKIFPVDMDSPKIFFPCSKKKLTAYDCLWLLGDIPLVSQRLAHFLAQKASVHIQLLKPTSIAANGEEVTEDYYIVNAAQTIRAVDKSKSVAELSDSGSILYFNEIWFHDTAAGMGEIARERDSGDLLISQELADAMIENRFKGDKGLGFYIANRSFTPYKDQA